MSDGTKAELTEPAAVASSGGPRDEAREGLLGLGYTPVEVERLLDAANGESAEELIASALRGNGSARGDRAAA